jgi:hypothetical protein
MTDTTPDLRLTRGSYLRQNSTPGHGRPTAKQREAWQAVERTGSQIEAAAAIGISQGALQTRMHGYQRAMGTTGRLPGARVYANGVTRGTGPWAQLRATVAAHEATIASLEAEHAARIVELEAEVARLHAVIADLEAEARPWVAVHARLERIERAVGSRVAFVPDHRRVSDGGRSVKEQRKALRPTG